MRENIKEAKKLLTLKKIDDSAPKKQRKKREIIKKSPKTGKKPKKAILLKLLKGQVPIYLLSNS